SAFGGTWVRRCGRARSLEREQHVDIARGEAPPELPDTQRRKQDDELDDRRNEVRRDGGSRLRTQDDGAERPLEDEECGETDARDEASLASARDGDRHHRVADGGGAARGERG